ncbi:hypothetical protein MX054_003145 [Enterobacter cloacae]|nr:hypothetical protein [Enterobacter cloacae]EJC0566320.1 hypothetical protein [Enterobacter cloacae]
MQQKVENARITGQENNNNTSSRQPGNVNVMLKLPEGEGVKNAQRDGIMSCINMHPFHTSHKGQLFFHYSESFISRASLDIQRVVNKP